MSAAERTPIIVGVGQFTERLEDAGYQGLSPVEIAAGAVRRALEDAGGGEPLRAAIDMIATTRTFEDSIPVPSLFGKSNNFPRSIAQRVGLHPRGAVWEKAGGNTPQQLAARMCERLADGEIECVVLAGAEAISTQRHLQSRGEKRDWAETVEGEVEDHGWGLKGMITQAGRTHGLVGAPPGYALLEQVRRGRLGASRSAYADAMGRLFAPFTAVAAANPYACAAQQALSAAELVAANEGNRMIADPYRRRLVSRDQVNQGAAVLLTTTGRARALGIAEDKWVYLHGYADLTEREIMERQDLGASPAAQLACTAALDAAGLRVDDIAYFDFYSCFPIAVFNAACDGLGLSPDDPRGLTVTGGLPYFGGPGNNYSMHAIATLVERLRARPGSYGFVGANGGVMSKYSAGVYSTRPKPWRRCSSAALQARIDALPAPAVAEEPEGEATVESYTVVYAKGAPEMAIVIGRLTASNERFIANTEAGDTETLRGFVEADALHRHIHVRSLARGNRVTFSAERMAEFHPAQAPVLQAAYEHCLVERHGHLLEVTINRPEARNCLHPFANEELAAIFDAFEADDELWVAILTGAGTEAFCAGADLKYGASGKPQWVPKSGFGGLTRRVRTKPVIAAVNGIAMGGGTEIGLACDVVVADERAQFALSEVRVGLIAGAGGIARLPRQIPKKLAVELILTGRRVSAQEMQRLGLVNRTVPAGAALAGAREIAAEILEASPTSVRLSMGLLNAADGFAAEIDAVRYRGKIIDELLTSEDMIEGMSAFAQKRKPKWMNR